MDSETTCSLILKEHNSRIYWPSYFTVIFGTIHKRFSGKSTWNRFNFHTISKTEIKKREVPAKFDYGERVVETLI